MIAVERRDQFLFRLVDHAMRMLESQRDKLVASPASADANQAN